MEQLFGSCSSGLQISQYMKRNSYHRISFSNHISLYLPASAISKSLLPGLLLIHGSIFPKRSDLIDEGEVPATRSLPGGKPTEYRRMGMNDIEAVTVDQI